MSSSQTGLGIENANKSEVDGPYITLCCGSRDWTDAVKVRRALSTLPRESIIVHGDCRGADKMCGRIAKELNLEVIAVPADWNKHGRSAGPKRNQEMLDSYQVTRAFAFHDNIEASKGTIDMVKRLRKAGIATIVIQ